MSTAPHKALLPLTCPFTVLVDTREQLDTAYTFEGLSADARQGRRPLQVPTCRLKLNGGDYSVEGLAGRVEVERKATSDLFGTIGQQRARWIRKLDYLNTLEVAAVVVEAEWSQIYAVGEVQAARESSDSEEVRHAELWYELQYDEPAPWSKLPPKSVLRGVIAWQQRFPRVHWWFCPGRAFAERLTFRILERAWKEEHKQKGPQ